MIHTYKFHTILFLLPLGIIHSYHKILLCKQNFKELQYFLEQDLLKVFSMQLRLYKLHNYSLAPSTIDCKVYLKLMGIRFVQHQCHQLRQKNTCVLIGSKFV